MTTSIGSSQPPPTNSSLSASAEPSHSLKRRLSASSDSEEAPVSKRQKIVDWMVLYENSGDFLPIPDNVVNLILSYCKASALVRMGTTCRRFLYFADRAPMWRELCKHAKLSVKENASYRLEFLSAIAEEDEDAYSAKAFFFTNSNYIKPNWPYALDCLDHIINNDSFKKTSGLLSMRQLAAILKKGELFFRDSPFDRSAFSPEQISSLYDQLECIVDRCSLQDMVAKAALQHTVMKINDSALAAISYTSCCYTLNSIRLDRRKFIDIHRNTAEYLLGVLCFWKEAGRWDHGDFSRFREFGNELPDAERSSILKKCLADITIDLHYPWILQLAKMGIATMRLQSKTEEITDKQAYEILESLKNNPSRIPTITMKTIEDLMQSFRDQKRI